jgi:hypothetical protein
VQSRILLAGGVLALCLGGGVAAQETQQAPPDASKPAVPAETQAAPTGPGAASEKLLLKEGSEVSLKFAQDVSSKTAADDDTVNLVLDQDIKVGDVVVVKAGAKAVGTITHAKRAGMLGKAGELNMKLDYLILDDGHLRLRGTKGKEGDSKTGTAVALTVLFGPIGLIKHGKEVQIKQGTPLLVYTDENFTFSPSKVAGAQ